MRRAMEMETGRKDMLKKAKKVKKGKLTVRKRPCQSFYRDKPLDVLTCLRAGAVWSA